MPMLRHLLLRAARQIASDPQARARASELFQKEVRPRAEAAWHKARPKLQAAQAEFHAISREADPRREPAKFAAKLKERFIDRNGPKRN